MGPGSALALNNAARCQELACPGRRRVIPIQISNSRRLCEERQLRSNPDCRSCESLDCFASLAMTCDDIPATRTAPRLVASFCPREGAGNAGRPMRPQPRMQKQNEHTSVVTTGSPVSNPALPARLVLTVFSTLSLVNRALLSPSPARCQASSPA